MGEIKPFYYSGSLPSSKSLMNRALIVKDFFPQLKVIGESEADDVVRLRQCLLDLEQGKTQFDCGSGGTTFRFFLALLSRHPGRYLLEGSERLFSRPHEPLFQALRTLGVQIQKKSSRQLEVISQGWQVEQAIYVDQNQSSQYLSALLLSSWNLERAIEFYWEESSSQSYLDMTLALLESLGMKWELQAKRIKVLPRQQSTSTEVVVECDMSSAFTLAAMAASSGELHLHNFPRHSLQPDYVFVDLLKKMGAIIELRDNELIVKKNHCCAMEIDLSNNPDLFPVLSILLSRAQGVSRLRGLEVLKYKESNRLKRTTELLSGLGIDWQKDKEALLIYGQLKQDYPPHFQFDPDEDHRMAMAAALARLQGANIEILKPEVVNKSFPGFWEMVSL